MKGTEQIVADRYREYSDAFVQAARVKDVTLLRPYGHVPSMSISEGQVQIMETEAQSDERWSRALSNLPADYHNSTIHTVDVILTSSKSAVVSADISRFNKNGDEYVRFWCSYVFVKTDEDWKISVWITHDPGKAPQAVRA